MRQEGTRYAEEWLRQGKPANTSTFAETVPRWACGTDGAIAASGVVLSAAIPLVPGDIATNITFVTGGTAAGTPTAGFAALYDPDGALLAQTADFGSTARAADTAYTVALASAQVISTPGLYYVSISFTASTVPTLVGAAVDNAIIAGAAGIGQEILVQSHGSGVGATAPSTITSATTTAMIPWLAVT